jgi:hypothetical protein
MLAQSSQLPKDLNKMQPIICIDGQSTDLDIPKNQVLCTGGTAGLFSAVQLISEFDFRIKLLAPHGFQKLADFWELVKQSFHITFDQRLKKHLQVQVQRPTNGSFSV